jgi:uncharacterized membrane protein YphA (DoxX/SURF4 family)
MTMNQITKVKNSSGRYDISLKKEIIINIISGLFILLFLYAAMNKFLEFEKFNAQLGQSPMLNQFAGIIAWVIPIAEIGIAILLTIPRTTLIGLYVSFTLMVMFTAYIGTMLGFSEHMPCSCGGILQKLGWKEHMIFNSIYVVLGLIGILLQENLIKEKRT